MGVFGLDSSLHKAKRYVLGIIIRYLFRIFAERLISFPAKGSPPDLEVPTVLSEIRRGTQVKSLCANISSELLRDFNYALVWGTSAKHSPQRCGLHHRLDGKFFDV